MEFKNESNDIVKMWQNKMWSWTSAHTKVLVYNHNQLNEVNRQLRCIQEHYAILKIFEWERQKWAKIEFLDKDGNISRRDISWFVGR